MSELTEVACPNCGILNRAGATFCAQCGHAIELAALGPFQPEPEVAGKKDQPGDTLTQKVSQMAGNLMQGLTGLFRNAEPGEAEANALEPQPIPFSASQPTVPLNQQHARLLPGDWLDDRYGVLQVYPLTYSNYYAVYDLACGCGRLNLPMPGGICAGCQRLLPRYLVHEASESSPGPTGSLGIVSTDTLVELSRDQPFIVPHYQVRWLQGRTYVWLPPLAQWRSLAKVKTPVPLNQVIAWGQHLASALATLTGYVYYDPHPSGIEKIIIDGDTARLADLSTCRQVLPGQSAPIGRDTAFLARVLYYLVSGIHLDKRHQANLSKVPAPLRAVIERGVRGEYQHLDEMLADLSGRRPPGDYGQSLKPVSGKASHPGQVRTVNEDSLFVFEFTRVQESRGVPLGLYLVADGLGGHQAGEIASRTVSKIVTERVLKLEVLPGLQAVTTRLHATPASVLAAAIKEANQTLHAEARSKGSNMGTTLTAALIIGDTATIANVGDSRTYLLRNRQLRQMSIDHSLVASLVAAGIIRPDEVRTHPQRNQIYRNLGDKAEVEIDIFSETLQRGDQLLLCSDGLWEMVLDDNLARTLQKTAGPQEACDQLIQQANANGGEDNVTVIVVRLE